MQGDRQTTLAMRADAVWRSLFARAAAAPIETEAVSVFAHALVLDIAGEQYTLLARGGRPAPGALLTGVEDFGGIEAGARVSLSARQITIEAEPMLTLDASGLEYFSCVVTPLTDAHPFEVGEPPYSIDPPGLAAAIARVARSGSFVPESESTTTPFARAISARLDSARTDFRLALAAPHESTQLRTSTAGLIGLGVGLTPSGDDYLVGVLALLSLYHDATMHRDALATSVTELLSGADGVALTTPTSRHFLLAACNRSFQHDLAAAARAVLTAQHDLDEHLAAAAAVGSTSGSDALQGLSDAFTVLATSDVQPTTGPGPRPATKKVNTMTEQQWPELVATATADEVRAALASGSTLR